MPTAIARLIACVTIATLIACGSSGTVIERHHRRRRPHHHPRRRPHAHRHRSHHRQRQPSRHLDQQQPDRRHDRPGRPSHQPHHRHHPHHRHQHQPTPTKSDTITLTIDPAGALRWTRQFGTSGDDIARGIATDPSGNATTTGNTSGALEGSIASSSDAFIRSYDRDGNHRWTRQFGTSSTDVALAITTDANGNTYTTGNTDGALEGSNAGGWDVFIRSYGR
jgi:hypothetical protein